VLVSIMHVNNESASFRTSRHRLRCARSTAARACTWMRRRASENAPWILRDSARTHVAVGAQSLWAKGVGALVWRRADAAAACA